MWGCRIYNAKTYRAVTWGCRSVVFFCCAFFIYSEANSAGLSKSSEINCDVLLAAKKNKLIDAEFYKKKCGKTPAVKANNLFSTRNLEQVVQAISTRSPSMLQMVKGYGSPDQVIALLGQNTLDNKKSLLSSLNWRSYHGLINYLTSSDIDFYIEEYLFSKPTASDNSSSNSRFTTLFWIALRSGDPFFLKKVLAAHVSPYRLEAVPSLSNEFPCAA